MFSQKGDSKEAKVDGEKKSKNEKRMSEIVWRVDAQQNCPIDGKNQIIITSLDSGTTIYDKAVLPGREINLNMATNRNSTSSEEIDTSGELGEVGVHLKHLDLIASEQSDADFNGQQ